MKDAIRHLDKRFVALRPLARAQRPPKGWLRAVRDALGMTTAQLGKRLGVSQPRIVELEQSEVSGRVTLNTLQRAAEALGCRLVYALVPDRPLSDTDFEGLPYQNLEVEGNRVRLLSNAPEALLRELFRRGYDIRDLQVVGADLEEAFLDLTRHAEKETVA